MGYSLEFFSISWDKVDFALKTRNPDLLDAARSRAASDGLFDLEPDDGTSVWQNAINELTAARGPGQVQPTLISDEAALAFVAVVRHMGEYIGAITHASASAEAFLEGFLAGAAANRLKAPDLVNLLTGRPFLGFLSDAFPSWGGLRHSDLLRLVPNAVSTIELDDFSQSWWEDMSQLIQLAAASETDLVTLYL